MSHELRTPLNSLLILARLLAQNPGRNLTAKQVEYANVIHSAGSDLLQLINDILDLSKVEAGRMDVRAERFTLAALIEDIQATFRPLTAEKGLDFEVSVAGSAPSELVTDRQRLRQVLGNLLSNAVKFTERGRVTLQVAATSVEGTGGRPGGPGDEPVAVFSVTDTGIGIAPENLAVIFGAFQQGDGTLSRRYSGTGLGLSIASEVSALLGGTISATSDLGHGSTFTLSVPAALPDNPPSLSRLENAFALPDAVTQPGHRGARSGYLVRAAARPPPRFPPAWPARRPPRRRRDRDRGEPAADRRVLVFESTSGGLLTLLAHSAVSDLAQLSAAARRHHGYEPRPGDRHARRRAVPVRGRRPRHADRP